MQVLGNGRVEMGTEWDVTRDGRATAKKGNVGVEAQEFYSVEKHILGHLDTVHLSCTHRTG